MNIKKKMHKSFMIDDQTYQKLLDIHEISYNSLSDLICEGIELLYDQKIGAKEILK